jgi:hypothetical protein
MKYNTTIASFVTENEYNNNETKEEFETNLVYDEVLTDAYPTLVYVKESNLIAWYEVQVNLGYKP